MRLTEATVTNYRGIKHYKLQTMGKPVILSGGNGAGKTSLCAAIQSTLAGITHSRTVAPYLAHNKAEDGYHVTTVSEGDAGKKS